jgi:beta-lactamase regulating signal transducer with metallopeptidase domain
MNAPTGAADVLDTIAHHATPVLYASAAGAALAAGVLFVDLVAGRRLAPSLRVALWILVLLRMAVPLTVGVPVPATEPAPTAEPRIEASEPRVATPSPVLPVIDASAEKPAAGPTISAPQPHANPPTSARTWPQWLAGFWAIGCAAGLATVLTAHLRAWHMRRRADLHLPTPLTGAMADAVALARPRRRVRLGLSDDVTAPVLVGLFRPTILLPRACVDALDADELRMLLLHELAHHRRGDLWWQTLASLVVCVHWFNPLAHLAARRSAHLRELACDDRVLAWLGRDRAVDYGRMLLKVLEHSTPRPRPLAAAGMGRAGMSLQGRFAMIVSERRQPRRLASVCVTAVALLACACTLLRAQTTTSPAASTSSSRPVGSAGPKIDSAGLGVGDELQITLSNWGGPGVDRVLKLRVDPTGEVSLPKIGVVKAQGLSTGDLEEVIERLYREEALIEDVSVRVARTSEAAAQRAAVSEMAGGNRVLAGDRVYYIAGGVRRPGVYAIGDRKISLTHALIAAGGAADGAEDVSVVIARPGNPPFQKEFGPMSVGHPLLRDFMVQVDDIILVRAIRPEPPQPDPVNRVLDIDALLGPDGKEGATTPETIVNLIQSTVRPEAWRDNGGTEASISVLNRKLVVSAPPEMLAEVEAFVKMLKEQAPAKK